MLLREDDKATGEGAEWLCLVVFVLVQLRGMCPLWTDWWGVFAVLVSKLVHVVRSCMHSVRVLLPAVLLAASTFSVTHHMHAPLDDQDRHSQALHKSPHVVTSCAIT